MARNTSQPQSALAVQLVSGTLVLSPIIQFAVLAALSLSGVMPEEGFASLGLPEGVLGGAAVVYAFVAAGLSFAVRPRIENTMVTQAGPVLAGRMRTVLVSMAICESGAVVGFAVGLIGGGLLWPGIAMGIAVLGCARHFPSRQWLEMPAPGEGGRDAGA